MSHPNAAAAAGMGGLGVLVVWLCGHLGVDLNSEQGAAIAVALASIVLFVGRRGVKGVIDLLWQGDPDL
jgi:hypothetical protein